MKWGVPKEDDNEAAKRNGQKFEFRAANNNKVFSIIAFNKILIVHVNVKIGRTKHDQYLELVSFQMGQNRPLFRSFSLRNF